MLCFVTSNINKVKEVETLLGIGIEIVDIKIDEIQTLS